MKTNTYKSIGIYYILNFLRANKQYIKGKCLVFLDAKNLIPFVKKIINTRDVTVIFFPDDKDELKQMEQIRRIKNNSYETVIAINTLNRFGDYESFLQENLRILKGSGTHLSTVSSFALPRKDFGVWGFTEASMRYIFEPYKLDDNLFIQGYGNVLAGRYLIGDEDSNTLSKHQLDHYDPYFPLIIGTRLKKVSGKNYYKKRVAEKGLAAFNRETAIHKILYSTLNKATTNLLLQNLNVVIRNQEPLLMILRRMRAVVTRLIKNRDAYLNSGELEPISKKYGFDRGKPIDRHFIESFLNDNRDCIKGRCLEIVDNTYTRKFGGDRTTTSDALDIFPTRNANIHGDLRNLTQVQDSVYDCIIVTQTFNVIDDYNAAIKECLRILKSGGTLLATVPTLSPCWNLKINLWRYSKETALHVFSQYFGLKNTSVKSYGNKNAVKGFWVGLSMEDLKAFDLTENDKDFPLTIGIRAIKK